MQLESLALQLHGKSPPNAVTKLVITGPLILFSVPSLNNALLYATFQLQSCIGHDVVQGRLHLRRRNERLGPEKLQSVPMKCKKTVVFLL